MPLDKPVLRMARALADNAERWRARRGKGESMKDPHTVAITLKIAQDYEALARGAEIRTNGAKPITPGTGRARLTIHPPP